MSGSNRLARETSLYLRQHANNPVDWFPWGPEALALAQQLDRPIFLSVGYSACHWCHVMERESFEDAATAELMNAHFVCIKVDREERPDIDDIYMKAVQLLNRGQGGWPMSVWMTPEQQPFFAGTYFPPDERYGRPSFRRVLTGLANAWQTRREDVARSSQEITTALSGMGDFPERQAQVSDENLLVQALEALARAFDSEHGGFGSAPKFPHALELRLLLRIWKRFGDERALGIVRHTLDNMARGGMYDQIGGGFHRYSVDAEWLVPHFEKMLYDNALLAVAYLEAHQATGCEFYRRIVEETLDYVIREMTCPAGGFYSTQDADSEGEEGKFFVWSKSEFDSVAKSSLAAGVWGVTERGNFEGHNILCRRRSDAEDAAARSISLDDFRAEMRIARQRLFEHRSLRIWPGRDEKILTSWNGLMIAAFARAGAVFDRADYIDAAIRAARFILSHLRTADGRLLRTSDAEGHAKLAGYLEDYAFVADALTHLYEATFDVVWLAEAARLMDTVLAQFADEKGGFFTTAADHESLLLRIKDQHDGSTPSGNAMAVTALGRLAEFLDRPDYRDASKRTLSAFRGVMESHPAASGQMLIALDFNLGPIQEVVITGDCVGPEVQEMVRMARRPFSPRRIVVSGDGPLPLLKDRVDSPTPKLYFCENMSCRAPIGDLSEAKAILES